MSNPSSLPAADRPKAAVFLIVALIAVGGDLVSKEWAFVAGMGHSRTVIEGVLSLTPTHNDGVVWGTFQGKGKNLLFILVSAAAVPIIARMFWTFREHRLLSALALGGVLGGTLGNLYDRIIHQAVRDWLYVHVDRWDFRWPIFNVADAFICTGAILFALCVMIRKEGRQAAPGPLATGAPAPPQA